MFTTDGEFSGSDYFHWKNKSYYRARKIKKPDNIVWLFLVGVTELLVSLLIFYSSSYTENLDG